MIAHTVRIIAIWITIAGLMLAVGTFLILAVKYGPGGAIDVLHGFDLGQLAIVGTMLSAWPVATFVLRQSRFA